MTDKQTTLDQFEKEFNQFKMTEDDCPGYQIEYFAVVRWIFTKLSEQEISIQEEREKVLREVLPEEQEIPLQQYDYDEIDENKLGEIATNWRITGENICRQQIILKAKEIGIKLE